MKNNEHNLQQIHQVNSHPCSEVSSHHNRHQNLCHTVGNDNRCIGLVGHAKSILKTDEENSIVALPEEVKALRTLDTAPENSPIGEHQSNGAVKRYVHSAALLGPFCIHWLSGPSSSVLSLLGFEIWPVFWALFLVLCPFSLFYGCPLSSGLVSLSLLFVFSESLIGGGPLLFFFCLLLQLTGTEFRGNCFPLDLVTTSSQDAPGSAISPPWQTGAGMSLHATTINNSSLNTCLRSRCLRGASGNCRRTNR